MQPPLKNEMGTTENERCFEAQVKGNLEQKKVPKVLSKSVQETCNSNAYSDEEKIENKAN